MYVHQISATLKHRLGQREKERGLEREVIVLLLEIWGRGWERGQRLPGLWCRKEGANPRDGGQDLVTSDHREKEQRSTA